MLGSLLFITGLLTRLRQQLAPDVLRAELGSRDVSSSHASQRYDVCDQLPMDLGEGCAIVTNLRQARRQVRGERSSVGKAVGMTDPIHRGVPSVDTGAVGLRGVGRRDLVVTQNAAKLFAMRQAMTLTTDTSCTTSKAC